MQGQNRRERRFCFSRNFFCFRCKSTRLTIRKFTHFKHRKPTMKWQKNKTYITNQVNRIKKAKTGIKKQGIISLLF